ncbi:MAG: alpha/beta fold hydrolase [Alphaproteobacteria bacterium]|nr:alpha/beta fold hydrolase [Alphaproteobacteria bacterium]
MPAIRSGDVELWVEDEGDGPVVLFATGLGGTAVYWTPQMAAFLAAGYRVVRWDHRGTGRSTLWKGRYTVELMTEDAIAVLDALDIDRCLLVGHSTGGAIGQVMALSYPRRLGAMVLADSWAGPDDHLRLVFGIRGDLLRAGGPVAYARMAAILLFPPQYVRDNAAAMAASAVAAEKELPSADILQARMDMVVGYDRRADLRRIATSTLVCCARDDILTPLYASQELAHNIPGADLHVFADGGHGVTVTRPAEFNAVTLAWLARHR